MFSLQLPFVVSPGSAFDRSAGAFANGFATLLDCPKERRLRIKNSMPATGEFGTLRGARASDHYAETRMGFDSILNL